MMRVLRALPPQFALIVPATVILYLVSPLLAEGSVSGSSILIVFSFASILAIAAIGQTLVIQQGGLDLSVPGVISLAAVLVTKYPDGDNSALAPWIAVAIALRFSLRTDLRNCHYALSRHGAGRDARSQCAALWHGAVSHQGYVDRGSAADAERFRRRPHLRHSVSRVSLRSF